MKTEFKVGDYLTVDVGDLNNTGHPLYEQSRKTISQGDTIRVTKFVNDQFGISMYDQQRKQVGYLSNYRDNWTHATPYEIAAYNKEYGIIQKNLKAVKQVTTKIKGVERDLTVVAIINNGQVRVGYAVRNPEDEKNDELSEKIATGRALADRTNLADMTVGIGMDKKYILYAIVEHFVRQIERGSIEVKGIK